MLLGILCDAANNKHTLNGGAAAAAWASWLGRIHVKRAPHIRINKCTFLSSRRKGALKIHLVDEKRTWSMC